MMQLIKINYKIYHTCSSAIKPRQLVHYVSLWDLPDADQQHHSHPMRLQNNTTPRWYFTSWTPVYITHSRVYCGLAWSWHPREKKAFLWKEVICSPITPQKGNFHRDNNYLLSLLLLWLGISVPNTFHFSLHSTSFPTVVETKSLNKCRQQHSTGMHLLTQSNSIRSSMKHEKTNIDFSGGTQLNSVLNLNIGVGHILDWCHISLGRFGSV